MAFTYTGSTTLSAALNTTDNEFTVASTTGVTKGMILVTAAEIMRVEVTPTVAGRVTVRRGFEGTRALPHNSGDTVFFANPSDFGLIRDNALRLFGPNAKLPDICIPGTRGIDALGYEYILLDSTATIVPGATVLISKDGLFTASVLTASGHGNVAVMMEDATSDQWAWAMIRGLHSHVKLGSGSSLMTSTGVLLAATSVSTPAVGLVGLTTSQAATSTNMDGEVPRIHRMWPASAWTSVSTSATSETGGYCTAWLEFPYLDRRLTS